MKQENIKRMLAITVVGLILLSIAFVSLKYQVENTSVSKEDEKSLFVKILADANSGTSPLSVNFKSLLLNEEGATEYLWDFGDGHVSDETGPTHTYNEEGKYSCKLTVTDKNTKKIDYFNITVLKNNPPDVKILVDKTTAFRPATINFDAQVFDPEGEELEYEWKLKYPPFFAYEKVETYNQKNFSKKFWRNGNYVAELTVTDEAGNSRTQYVRIQMQKSKPEVFFSQIKFSLALFPTTFGFIWIFMKFIRFDNVLNNWLDENWLEWPEVIQKIANNLINYLGIPYEPPIPHANLKISDISEINHSSNVDVSGGVSAESSESSSIVIENEDKSTAKNMYITLYNPLTEEKGISDAIEKEEVEISLDVGGLSKKLFYNGEYTSYENCYFIQNLATGDKFTGDITVTLNEADSGTFEKGTYDCDLYLYQEKADYVDIVPLKIVL